MKPLSLLTVIVAALSFCESSSLAQTISNTLYDDTAFNAKQIDQSKPVGVIDGAGSVTLTGAATYAIPIKCPPGTNGMAPKIAISYSSQAGSGVMGIGWSIEGLSAITRVSKDLYHDGMIEPIKFEDDDALTLDGTRLIHASGNYGQAGSTYRLETDNFSIITLYDNGANQWFRVVTKDGTIMDYGSASNSRLLNNGNTEVIAWRLNRITDVNGNYIDFEYTLQQYALFAQNLLIDKILYTRNDNAGLTTHFNEIKFNYSASPQSNILYVAGSGIIMNRLITSIEIRGENSQLFKTYAFNYGHNDITSFLKEIIEKDANGSELNSTIFKYGDETNDYSVESANLNGLGYRTHLFSGDFNGDGVQDIVSTDEAIGPGYYSYIAGFTVYTKNGSGNSYLWTQSVPVNNGATVSYKKREGLANVVGVRKTDFNGDGLEDILTFKTSYNAAVDWYYVDNMQIYYGDQSVTLNTTPTSIVPVDIWNGQSKYFHTEPQKHESFFIGDFNGDKRSDVFMYACSNDLTGDHYGFIYEQGTFQKSVTGINNHPFNTHEFKAEVIDFDGDGKNEVIFTGNLNYYVYTFAKQANGDYIAVLLASGSNGFPSSWYTIYTGDFNGDGKTDLLGQAGDGSHWKISYSTGVSFLTASFNFNHLPSLGIAPDKILLADYNGDGKTDIVQIYKDPNGSNSDYLSIYYSAGLSFFTEFTTNTTDVYGILTPSDLDGDGRADIISQKSVLDQPNFIFFKKGSKEMLLEKIKDGLGRTVHFTYKTLADGGAFYNQGVVTGSYPFNNIKIGMNIVASLGVPDGNGGESITTYSYEEAVAHLAGRGFLGFKKVTSVNNTLDIKSESKFEVDTDPNHLTMYKTEDNTYLNSTGQQLSHTTYDISFQNTIGKAFYQKLNSSSEQNSLTGATTTTTNTYDNYGNITQSVVNVNNIETTTTDIVYVAANTPVPAKPSTIDITKTRTGAPMATDGTSFSYDSKGRVSSKTDRYKKLPNMTVYSYDDYGNIETETVYGTLIPYTALTKYEYDDKGRFPVSVTNPLNQTATTTWNALWGKPETVTGIDGLSQTNTYDSWGKLTSTTVPTFSQTYTVTYSDGWDPSNGAVWYTNMSHPGRPDVKVWYDILGREIRSESEHFNNQKLYTSKTYNNKGQLISEEAPHLSGEPVITTTNTYNPYGLPATSSNVYGTTTNTYSYGNGKTTITTSSPKGQTTTITDAAGRLLEETDNGGKITYSYDSRGNVMAVKQGVVTLVSNTYDTYGRKISMTDCDAGTITYTYDSWNRLVSEKDAKNQTTTYTYDVMGKVLTRTGPEGTTTYEYYTDPDDPKINKLSKVTGFNGITDEFSYDFDGNLGYKKRTIDNKIFETSYSYNAYGDVMTVTYNTGFGYENTYDANGFLEEVRTVWSGFPYTYTPETLFTAVSMNGNGQYTSYTKGNGLTTTKTYDYGFPLTSVTPGVQDIATHFNKATGNLDDRVDNRSKYREDFTYDNLNRLTAATVSYFGSPAYMAAAVTVTYDQSGAISQGNIISKTDVGNYQYGGFPRHAVKYVSNSLNQVSVQQQDITYTPFRKAEKVTENGFEQTFTYDGSYDRAKSVLMQNGNTLQTRYYMGDWEYNEIGNRYIYYVGGGDGLCAIVEHCTSISAPSKDIHYVYQDHLGSILTVTDEQGNIEAEQSFDAWGRSRDPHSWDNSMNLSSSVWLYRGYTAHEHMPEFGLINMNGRMYDPLLGRMLSPDNYVQGGSQGYNRYSYALNNPLKYTDPTGELPVYALPYVAYSPKDGWDVGVTFGVGLGMDGMGGVGIFGNIGYSGTQAAWNFGVGAYAGLANASVNYNTQSGWSAYAGVGFAQVFGNIGGFSSNITNAGVGWSEYGGFYATALGFSYSAYGLSWNLSIGYTSKELGIGLSVRSLNEMEREYGGGDDPEDAKRVTMINGGFLDEVIIRGERLAHNMANSVVLTVTGVISPIINQAHTIYKEGLHKGPAYYPENRNYAVPYKLKDWKPIRTTDMMGETLDWNSGKEVINATVNTVSSVFPVKVVSPNYPVLKYILPSVVKYPAKQGIKGTTHFKRN